MIGDGEIRRGWSAAASSHLCGHWRLNGEVTDASPGGNHGVNLGAQLATGESGAGFDGRESYVEIPHDESLNLGAGDFSISL